MRFLVVDPSIGFATLLAEELERLGHAVDRCSDGNAALIAAKSNPPDLAFLDMGLEEPDALAVGHELRSIDEAVRLVMIPLNGAAPSEEIEGLAIQGILPKPFFLPELPERIDSAMAAPLNGETSVGSSALMVEDALSAPGAIPPDAAAEDSAEPAGMPKSRPAVDVWFSVEAFEKNRRRIEMLMEDLAMEVGADGVLLTRDTGLVTWVGRFGESEAASLAQVVVQGWESSVEVARILGQEQLRFEQSIAGDNYLLYAVSVADVLMAVPVRGTAPLGLLRHQAREVAERVAALCLA